MVAQNGEDRENDRGGDGQAAAYIPQRQRQLESILQPGGWHETSGWDDLMT